MDATARPPAAGHTVVAVFEEMDQAEEALAALHALGLPREAVSLVLRDKTTPPGTADEDDNEDVVTGLTTGATMGGVVGGLTAGLLALLVPGIGPVLSTSILGSLLTGAAIGAAGGGILGALVGLGVPEGAAQDYHQHVAAGRILVTVHAQDATQARQAVTALDGHHAREVRAYLAPPPPSAGGAKGESGVVQTTPLPATDGDTGDVVAVEQGGPDVRPPADAEVGMVDLASSAPDDLGDWRSGGEAARPADGNDGESGVVVPSGCVAAAANGGPDVRPPAVAEAGTLSLTDATVPPSDTWAEVPAPWRSAGDVPRPAQATPGDPLMPAPTPSPETGLAGSGGYYGTPQRLSRSALSVYVPQAVAQPESGQRDTERLYGDADTEDLPPTPDLESGLVDAPTTGYYHDPRQLSRSALAAAAPAEAGGAESGIVEGPDAPRGYGDADTVDR